MEIKYRKRAFTLRLSPESYELHLQAGLLAFPIFNTFPSAVANSGFLVENTIPKKNGIGITATGIAPDLNGIPF